MNESQKYTKFEEIHSTNHHDGRKEVRYYLNKKNGASDLVVIGKQKKKKLGVFDETVSFSESFRYRICEKKLGLVKLTSRKEVIDWLKSIITEFLWVGPTWTCRKKRMHYEAYTRHGVKISVHDFVYVLAEEGKRPVAYVNDLYEDSRGNKMAVVRWFHKVDEVNLDLPRNSNNDKEILFSLCLQDLSVECIDGLATVLSPLHYQDFLKVNSHTTLIPFVCRNLFDNDVFKPFDITQVKGYWNQNIHKLMSNDAVGSRPRKRLRKPVDPGNSSDLVSHRKNEFGFKKIKKTEGVVSEYKHEYKIGSEIEVLSEDSGIRGMWLKAVVIKKHKDKIKVRYQDIIDAADESNNLEEWILSSRIAVDDQLGIRERGRMTVRPYRLTKSKDICLVDAGCVVDAWMHDGWWEGIVVLKESDDRIHVYFPGEKQRSVLGCKDLRYSEEWLGNGWKQMKNRADLLGSVSPATETNSENTKSHDNASSLTGTISDKEILIENSVDDRMKKDLATHLNWKWSTRKRRCYASENNSLVAIETRKHDGLTN